MSKGPTNTKPFKPRLYFNTEVTTKDICSYALECPVALGTYIGENPCFSCKYMQKIDVPNLLEERNKR
jgi:hypothetical protein